jgi:hypothetical protein
MPEQLMSTISQFKGRKIHTISHLAEVACSSRYHYYNCCILRTRRQLFQYTNTTRGRFQDTVNRELACSSALLPPVLPYIPNRLPCKWRTENELHTAGRQAEHGNAERRKKQSSSRRKKACVDRWLKGPWIRTGIGAFSLSSPSLLSHLGLIPPL